MLHTTEPSPRGRLVATTAACLVFLVHQDAQERTANQANLVFPDHLAFLAAHHWRSARKCHHHHASHAHQDHPDHQVHLANPVHPDQMATQVPQAKMVETVLPAQPDPTDHPVNPERMEKKDHLVNPLLVSQLLPVMLDLLAKTAHLDHLVKMAPPDPMEDLDLLDRKAHPAQLDHPATMELPVIRDHLVQMDQRANRVSAPNIAPPTVVSSSKTEQGDKHLRSLRLTCCSDEKPVIFMSIVAFIFFVIFNGQYPQPQSTILNTAAASPIISFGAF